MTNTLTHAIASAATAYALIAAPIAVAQPYPPGTGPVADAVDELNYITEDSPGWDCRTMGNGICGPGQGVQPGQYVDGQLVPWSIAEVPAWCKDICLGA